ncbi:MAG: cytochrome P460 family protein [Acidobacteriota bacterium]
MIKRRLLIALIAITGLTAVTHLHAASNSEVAYPTGYREWTHVKSTLISPNAPTFRRSSGLHHVYANEKAMEGYRTGQFADGSVIVFDLLEVKENDGITTEGARRFIDVMEKDSKRFAATGGWGFEEFKGDSQTERALTAQAQTACYNCHLQKKERGFVFSVYRQ